MMRFMKYIWSNTQDGRPGCQNGISNSLIFNQAIYCKVALETFRNKNAPFVKNFLNNYENGDIPFYALVEILGFGTLSKFYKNMKNPDKKQIALIYGIGYTYLESWIESISYVRNICAHYGRLYNAKLTKTPKLYRQDVKQGAVNNRIFGVLCCMKHLFARNRRWIKFLDGVEALFSKYSHVIITTMGFTENWREFLGRC